MKPYFENEHGKLYHGDCLEIMSKPREKLFDMVLADPPYGITQNKWDSEIPLGPLWYRLKALVKVDAAIALMAAYPFDKILGASNIREFKYEWIWSKNKASGHLNSKKMPLRIHENILIFYSSPPLYRPQKTSGHKPMNYAKRKKYSTNYGDQKSTVNEAGTTLRYPKTILEFAVVNNNSPDRIHPTQKPVDLFKYLIFTYTNPNETVLDFCAGSGTTAVAAEECGRKWVLIEEKEEHCEKIAKRLST